MHLSFLVWKTENKRASPSWMDPIGVQGTECTASHTEGTINTSASSSYCSAENRANPNWENHRNMPPRQRDPCPMFAKASCADNFLPRQGAPRVVLARVGVPEPGGQQEAAVSRGREESQAQRAVGARRKTGQGTWATEVPMVCVGGGGGGAAVWQPTGQREPVPKTPSVGTQGSLKQAQVRGVCHSQPACKPRQSLDPKTFRAF